MYITSDLFDSGADTGQVSYDAPTTLNTTHNRMSDSHMPALGKRKRWPDTDHTEGPGSSNCSSSQRSLPFAGRTALKRQALSHAGSDHNTWTTYAQGPMPCLASEHRPMKQLKRASSKRVPVLAKSTSHLMDIEFETPSSSLHTSIAMDLRPCHICHKAPTRKKDLENYHECERCREQTCFICARQCANGCREKICRRCCVEVGEEGDTLCLGCYATSVNS